MSTVQFFTAPGQNPFTTEEPEGDYVPEQALGAREPTALFIRRRYKQLRANYSRPAANSSFSYGGQTAYFVDDLDFTDERGGVQSWTRLWATVPASWSEPGGTFAFTFPAYTAGVAFGSIFAATGASASGSNYVVNTNATNIAVGDSVLFDINYVRSAQNYHCTFVTDALAASSGTSVTIRGILPGQSTFSGVTGTVREWSTGRTTPETIECDSVLQHDYVLSSETAIDTDLPHVDQFAPVASNGYETNTLSSGTATYPNSETYASMVAAGTLLVARPSDRRIYAGNIYERTTLLVKAQ